MNVFEPMRTSSVMVLFGLENTFQCCPNRTSGPRVARTLVSAAPRLVSALFPRASRVSASHNHSPLTRPSRSVPNRDGKTERSIANTDTSADPSEGLKSTQAPTSVHSTSSSRIIPGGARARHSPSDRLGIRALRIASRSQGAFRGPSAIESPARLKGRIAPISHNETGRVHPSLQSQTSIKHQDSRESDVGMTTYCLGRVAFAC